MSFISELGFRFFMVRSGVWCGAIFVNEAIIGTKYKMITFIKRGNEFNIFYRCFVYNY